MGMQVEDEEEDDSPPASPPLFDHTPLPLDHFVPEETKIKEERSAPAKQKIINFGVDFLLGRQADSIESKMVTEEKLESEHEQESF